MSEEKILQFEVIGSNIFITIQREEKLHALCLELLLELEECFEKLTHQLRSEYHTIRAIFIRSTGKKAFIVGADIHFMAHSTKEELGRFIEIGNRVMNRIERLPIPTVCLAQGFTLGGGLEFALACDCIVASSSSTFGFPETVLGLIPGFGGTQRLKRRVGIGRAQRMIYTGEKISAAEAERFGLIDWVFDDEIFDEEVEKLAMTFQKKSVASLQAAKRAIHATEALDGVSIERREFLSLFQPQESSNGVIAGEAREGLNAFLEKRTPNFL
jgi:enoyl-CoA hydratase